MQIVRLVLLLSVSLTAAAQSAKPTSPIILLKAGRLLDVRQGKYLSNQGVLIQNDRIKEVGPLSSIQSHAAKDAVVIDLSRATVLPGLIDSHAHLLDGTLPMDPADSILLQIGEISPAARALLGARMAREDL